MTPQRLDLLCQPAGTGKTRYCIDAFRKIVFGVNLKTILEPQAYFILPNKEHADRINDLLLGQDPALSSNTLFNSPVLTINELIQRFAGISKFKTPGEILRKNILSRILRHEALSYYEPVKKQKGFVEILSDFISEAKSSFLDHHEASLIKQKLRKSHPSLANKWGDLLLILQEYTRHLGKMGFRETEDVICSFLAEEEAVNPLKLLIFDGFYHFTPLQFQFLRKMSGISERTIVTLTMDKEGSRAEVFEYPAQTRQHLLRIGFLDKEGGEVFNHRAQTKSLNFLEGSLFNWNAQDPFTEKQNSISIFEATGISGEAEMIAREIHRLYREDEVHFSDICVLLRNIGPYEQTLRETFSRFNIPVNIHERKKLKQNPFVRAFIKWIHLLQRDWERPVFFSLIDSTYYGFEQETVRELKRKILEIGFFKGIDGYRMLSETLEGEEKAVLQGLLEWQERFSAVQTAEEFRSAIKEFIRSYQMPFRSAEKNEKTLEDYQAYHALENILEEIMKHYAPKEGGETALSELLDHLVEAVKLSLFSLPVPEKNTVQVYDIAFALQKEYKIIFVAGLLEGIFPQRIAEDPLMKDDERRVLGQAGLRFEERRKRISGEKYFFYMAVTRAMDKLYLTYPRFDLSGKEALPSFYVEEIRRLFGEKIINETKKDQSRVVPQASEVCREEDLFQMAAAEFFIKRDNANFSVLDSHQELLIAALSARSFPAVLREAFRNENAAGFKDPVILDLISKRKNPFSASQLEDFLTCPFRHFSSRVLRLADERVSMDPIDQGEIFHETLRKFYQETVPEKKENWILLKDMAKTREILSRNLEEVLAEKADVFRGEEKFRRDLFRLDLQEALENFLEAQAEKERVRKTLPRYFEWEFGTEGSEVKALERRSPQGGVYAFQGKIDRIDQALDSKKGVVLDYKSRGNVREHLKKIELGLGLQILLYVLAAQDLLKCEIIGGEICSIRSPAEQGGVYEDSFLDLGGKLKGEVLGKEGFRELLETMEQNIFEAVGRIRAGDISIHSKDCDHCPYDSLCRFETWRLIYSEEVKIWQRPGK